MVGKIIIIEMSDYEDELIFELINYYHLELM
jgi:hypothetical protein